MPRKVNGKRPPADAAAPAPGPPARPPLEEDFLGVGKNNAPMLAKALEDLAEIQKHAVFADIADEHPLAIADTAGTGSQDPISIEKLKAATKHTKMYRCADNFFRIDHVKTATRGVPLVDRNIGRIVDHFAVERSGAPQLRLPLLRTPN